MNWLNDKNKKIRKIVLDEVRKMVDFIDFKSHPCVICKSRKAYLCPYCFTERVYRRMKLEGIGKETRKEFLDFFGYRFENTYLLEEMERLGII